MTTQSSITPTTPEEIVYIRTAVPLSSLDEGRQRFLRMRQTQPPTCVDVTIGLDQLDFIQKCIIEATKNNPELAKVKDIWDDDMGKVLIDLIDMTVKEPGEYGSLHGWVI